MRKEREALLVATLAGLVIVSAAAFVLQPGLGRVSATGQGALTLQQGILTPRA